MSRCKTHHTQGRNEARWRPGQEASLAPSCSNLWSFRSKCSVLKKVLVTWLRLFGGHTVIRSPGIVFPFTPGCAHDHTFKLRQTHFSRVSEKNFWGSSPPAPPLVAVLYLTNCKSAFVIKRGHFVQSSTAAVAYLKSHKNIIPMSYSSNWKFFTVICIRRETSKSVLTFGSPISSFRIRENNVNTVMWSYLYIVEHTEVAD